MNKTEKIDKKLNEVKRINEEMKNISQIAESLKQNLKDEQINEININAGIRFLTREQKKNIITELHKELSIKLLSLNSKRKKTLKEI